MNPLVHSLLDRASQSLTVARKLFENGYHEAAIEQGYFAAFYCASAAIIAGGYAAGESLTPDFVKPHLLPAELARAYTRLATIRRGAVYAIEPNTTSKDASIFLTEVTQFLNTVKTSIRSATSHGSTQGYA